MKKLFSIILFLFCTQLFAQTVNDFSIPSRGNGGKVILAPKDSNGVQVPVLSVDPVTGISGGGFAGKNYLINGNADLAQRGVGNISLTTSGAYTLDRWRAWESGSTISIHAIISRATGYVPANGANKYAIALQGGDANVTNVNLQQRIESFSARELKRKVTLSMWAYTNIAAGCPLQVTYAAANAANDDDWSSETGTTTVALGTVPVSSFTFLSVTMDWSSLNTAKGMYILINSSGSTCFNNAAKVVYLTQIMLNEGNVPAPFKLAGGDIQGEIIKAQRFYEKSYNIDVDLNTATTAGSIEVRATASHIQPVCFKVTKRGSSFAMGYYSTTSGANNWRDNTAATNRAVVTSTAGASCVSVAMSTSVAGNGIAGHWAVDAEIN